MNEGIDRNSLIDQYTEIETSERNEQKTYQYGDKVDFCRDRYSMRNLRNKTRDSIRILNERH